MGFRFCAPVAFYQSEYLPKCCVITGRTEGLREAQVQFGWDPLGTRQDRWRWVTFTTLTPAQTRHLGPFLRQMLSWGVGAIAALLLLSGPFPGWFLIVWIAALVMMVPVGRVLMALEVERGTAFRLPVANAGPEVRRGVWNDRIAWLVYNCGQYALLTQEFCLTFSDGMFGPPAPAAAIPPQFQFGLAVAVGVSLLGLLLHLLPKFFYYPRTRYYAATRTLSVSFRASAKGVYQAYCEALARWEREGGAMESELGLDEDPLPWSSENQ